MTKKIDPIDPRSFPPVTPLSRVPDHYRQTLLTKSTECPRSAYLYEKYGGGPLTHPLAGGTLLHRAIERYIATLLDEGEVIGNGEIAKDILNEVLVESTDLVVGAERMDSIRSMMYHVAEGLAIDPDKVCCLETKVEVELNGRRISGTIDFAEVDAYRLTIRDWKSAFHSAAETRPEEDEEEEYVPTAAEWPGTLQLIIYAYALATGSIHGAPESFNFNEVPEFRLRQDHPRQFWQNEGTMAYREATISRETLLDWRLYLEAAVAKLDNAFATWDFPAQIGSHCDYCPASAECPIPAPLREFRGEIRNDADAVRALILWERAGNYRTELWNAIKGYMKRRGGRVRFGHNLEVHFKKVESERRKKKVEIFGSKMSGGDALRLAMMKKNEGIPFELNWETFYEKSVSTRLVRRKLDDAEVHQERIRKGLTP